jgi:hypothetical protein
LRRRGTRRRPSLRRCLALVGLALPVLAACAREGEGIVARLDFSEVPEGSGMAVSAYDAQRLWLINDSGNSDDLIAFDIASGSYRNLELKGGGNRDWEDLEAFDWDGESWLAVGDIGDNAARRDHITVYLLPEPQDLSADEVDARITLRLSYPDGARDAESLAVDGEDGTLYLLSKREAFPRLYRVALPAKSAQGRHELTLTYLGEVRSIPAPTEEERRRNEYGKFRAQPTAMSFFAPARRIALLTYGSAYIAPLGADGDWLAALNEALCRLPTPELPQAEAVAVDADGWVLATSEGRRAPVLRIDPAPCLD